MADGAPAERVARAFRAVIAAVVLFNEQVAHRTGMSLSESQFVHLLSLHGPMSPSELGRSSGLASGSVTGVIDRLEALGFVRRERHPSDRRKVVVVLNEENVEAAIAPHFVDQGEALATVIGRLEPNDLRAVAEFLEGLLDAGS